MYFLQNIKVSCSVPHTSLRTSPTWDIYLLNMQITRPLCRKFWVSRCKLEDQESVLKKTPLTSPPSHWVIIGLWEVRNMAVEQSFSNLKVFTDHSGPHYIQWVWAVPRSHIHNGLPGDADAAGPRLHTEKPGCTIDTRIHASRCDLSSTPVALRITTSSAAAYHSGPGFSEKQTQIILSSGKARMPPFDGSAYFL